VSAPEVVVRIPVAAGIGAVALVGAMLSGCSTHLVVSRDALQKDISARMARAGQQPQSVICKDDLIGEVGRTARCEVVLSPANTFEPVITVTGIDGNSVNYDMKPALSKEQLQKFVAGMVEKTGVEVSSVDCESGLEGDQGADAFCRVNAGGVTSRRMVEVKNVNGLAMSYDLVPMMTEAEIETSLLDRLEQQLGQRPDSATCTDNLEGKTGTSIDCLVVTGPNTRTFTVTVTTVVDSTIDYNYEAKD
jgi:hypothetical protein